MSGTAKEDLKKHKILPIGPGEAHLQDEITSYHCFICLKPENDDMVLIKTGDKKLSFACMNHKGVVQEFIRQFKRPPLGWRQSIIGALYGDHKDAGVNEWH